jgi:hypothetical protein
MIRLTAFVTKCFSQSMGLKGNVISVDPQVVLQSLTWMITRQQKNGSFSEPGEVFNKNMQVCQESDNDTCCILVRDIFVLHLRHVALSIFHYKP